MPVPQVKILNLGDIPPLVVHFQGSPDEIQDFLPIELNTMKNSAEDCLKYAKDTEAAFDQVSSGGSRFSQKTINYSTCPKHWIKVKTFLAV